MLHLDKLFSFWPLHRTKKLSMPFVVVLRKFRELLERNNRILELMGDMGDKLGGEYVFDKQYIFSSSERIGDLVFKLISDLSVLTQRKNVELFLAFERIQHAAQEELAGRHAFGKSDLALPLEQLGQDSLDAAGGKMNTLGVVRNVLGLPVPDGFVLTTKAFFEFLNHAGLRDKAKKALETWDGEDEEYFETISEEMRQAILQSELPRSLVNTIHAQLATLSVKAVAELNGEPQLFAVRSSAWGEDGESSFAGQYCSVLGVTSDNLQDAYKRVVAGAYSVEAWRYRLERGYHEEEVAMAVGVQLMVDARMSGLLQTCAPGSVDELLVTCAPGLGAPIMDGTLAGDSITLSRTPPHPVRSVQRHKGERFLQISAKGGTVWQHLSEKDRQNLRLTDEQLTQLARAAMRVESFLNRPVEMEWCFDQQNELSIVQARPMQIDKCVEPPQLCYLGKKEILLANQGTIAQQGVATGKVFIVRDDNDLLDFPYGAILISRFTSPRYSRIMHKVRGIITDIGSPAGHMATIAREHRIPTIVNAGNATEILKNGEEITLDASNNTIYQGIIPELRRFEITEQCVFEESYEYRLLRRLLQLITPLHLVDPKSKDFRPANCTSYHDITRYIHEKAVEELIRLSELHGQNASASHRFKCPLPLGLMIIDVEDGLRDEEADKKKEIELEDITSIPLSSLLYGILNTDTWSNAPVAVDLGSFMSSFTRTFASSMASPEQIGRNLAVVSKEYANLHLRLGYHFNIIDAYLCDRLNDNYIYFRFMGGVTGLERRSRRARFVARILEHFDFRIEIRGDLVVGRIKKISLERGKEKMKILGGLVGYTRQLDVLLGDDAELQRHIDIFMERIAPVLEDAK